MHCINKYFLLIFVLLLSLNSNATTSLLLTPEEKQWIAEHPQVTVGGGVEWAPFNFVNDEGDYDGVANDYLKLISKKSGLHFVIETRPTWKENLERFKKGELDLLPAVYYAKEREAYGNFSSAYFKMREFIFTLEDQNEIQHINDLKGKTVAIPKGYATIGRLKALHKDITIVETNSVIEAIQAVMSAKADALIEGQAVISYILQQNMITGLKGFPQTAFDPSYIYFLTAKKHPLLTSIIQKTIDSLSKEEKSKIKKHWLRSGLVKEHVQINFSEKERQWIKTHKNINFTGDPNWLPIEAFTKEGEYIGIIADLLAIVEKRTQLRFNKIATKTWDESLALLEDGSVNMLTETTDSALASKHLFTEAFIPNPIVVIMQDGSPYIASLHQLKSKSIVVIKDYGYVQKIKEKYPNYDFHEVANIQEGLSAVAEGKHDAMIATMALATYSIRTMQLNSIRVVGKTDFTTEVGFAVSRDYAPLVGILNKTLRSIDEQTKQNVLDKWVTQGYVEKIDYTLIWQITFVALLIILGTLFWSWRLKKEIARRIILEKRLADANKQITDSIEFASIIQQAFVPEQKELNSYFEEEFAIWQPRDIVGGDIYFFDQLTNENKAILMVIDCTGHGVPGAFVTMLVKALSRNLISFINQNDEAVSPAKLLAIFNRSLKHLLKQHDKSSLSNAGFDAAIIYIDKETSTLSYAGANIPLFYSEDQKIETIKADRHSIGYKTSDPNFIFTDHQVHFNENNQFYISSDGYLDQNGGEKGFPMGKKRFIKLLEENINSSMLVQQDRLEQAFGTWRGDEERNDDVTVVGFKCKGVER